MSSNFSIQVNGKLNLDFNASDSINQIKNEFPEAKGKEETIMLQLETFKNSNKKEEHIEGMLFVKIEMIEQVISESPKTDEMLFIQENEPNKKTPKEELQERFLQQAERRLKKTSSIGYKM